MVLNDFANFKYSMSKVTKAKSALFVEYFKFKTMKKTFIFYTDWIDYTKEMTRDEKGLFLETILAYQNWEELPNDMQPIKFIWSRIQKQLDEDNKKRSDELEKRKKAWKLWGLAKASKDKQVLASASNWKQILADNENVNDNVNVNKNEIVLSKDNKDKSFWKNDINKTQDIIKQKVLSLWLIYKSWSQERNRIQNILTAKDFWMICEKANMSRIDFVLNIIELSTKLEFWKWKIYNAETLYKHYASVYNEAVRIKSERKKPRWC